MKQFFSNHSNFKSCLPACLTNALCFNITFLISFFSLYSQPNQKLFWKLPSHGGQASCGFFCLSRFSSDHCTFVNKMSCRCIDCVPFGTWHKFTNISGQNTRVHNFQQKIFLWGASNSYYRYCI